jgi:hypothetical protein
MTAIGIADFSGMLPLRDPILLPDNNAQYSNNTWLYRGAIRGFRYQHSIATLKRSTSQQVYRIPLNNNQNDWTNSLWLEFPDPYIEGHRTPVVGDTTDRYYFFPSDQFVPDSGNWPSVPFYAPKANFSTNGPYYILGIPTPGVAPGVSPAAVVPPNPAEDRAYLYTYVSAYGEEGPPSPPTVAQGDPIASWTITVTSATAAQLANRNLTTIRLYRSVTDSSGNATYYQVTEIPMGVASSVITYHDPYESSDITNNIVLNSTVFTGPPAGLQGVVMMANGIMAGWTNQREVWFSEAYMPHAWPATYALTVDYNIVGMCAIGSSLSIMTQGQPFIATGTTPDTMTIGKITANEPCVSRGSIFAAGEGAYYASPNGLILLNTSGTINVTQFSMEREFWEGVEPEQWAAGRVALSYIAFIKGNEPPGIGGIVLDHIEKNVPASYLTPPTGLIVKNVYWDEWSGQLFVIHSDGSINWFNPPSGGTLLPWIFKSKKFRLPKPAQLKCFKTNFTVPAEVTIAAPTPQSRNVSQTQNFDPTKQYLIIRVYADGKQVLVREIVQDNEVLLIIGGFKATFWEFQFEGQINLFLFKAASSIKELMKA